MAVNWCRFCGRKINPSTQGKRRKKPMCYTCREAGAPDEFRCHGINSSKKRCKQWALEDKKYCVSHKHLEDKE
tara:strand:+ start:195 stop:413 length:219 start_codon:yes stop_codon:yes gene_type:complete